MFACQLLAIGEVGRPVAVVEHDSGEGECPLEKPVFL